MAEIPLLQIVDTMADLKTLVPTTLGQKVLLVGKNAVGDGLGGFYRWDNTDTTSTEDTTYLNMITSTVQGASGRWTRIFQKVKITGSGLMVNNGGVKNFYISGTTAANGKVTLYLTDDGTANGNALFSEIWSINANPQTNATGPADAVQSYRESQAANLKTVVYGFYKANAVTITLGMLLTPVASVGAGTVVQFRIDGI